MSLRHGGTPFALALAGALALSGCGDGRESSRLPRGADATPTVTTANQDDHKKATAERVFQYVSGRSAIRASPGQYPTPDLINYAEGRLATTLVADGNALEAKGHKQVGQGKLTVDPTVTAVDLSPQKVDGKAVTPFIELRGCVDESQTYLVDSAGKKVKNSQGKKRPVKFHVVNRNYPESTGWKISWVQELKGAC